MYKHACKIGLEGVVSKVRNSRYASGRTNEWMKKTCVQRETLAIAGFALDGKKFDGIYLGRRNGSSLVYAGKVDHGFDSASAKDLQARLKPLIRKTQPTARRSRIAGYGLGPSSELRSNIARSPRRVRYGIRSSAASATARMYKRPGARSSRLIAHHKFTFELLANLSQSRNEIPAS
jgi:bifunctional non-homologous end joining protein LigD